MSTARTAPAPNARRTRTTSIWRDGIANIGFELRGYWRQPDAMFFGFLFPIVMLAIFGAAFSSIDDLGAQPDGTGGITMAAYYLPGLAAAGIMICGTQNLAIDIATEKSGGWLRRLGSTPLSPVSYFIGKAGLTLITGVAQLILLIAFAAVVFQVDLPTEPALWGRLAWLFGLGIVTMTLLGVALSALPRSAKSASAVVIPVVLILMFVSGVYLQFDMLPEWLQTAAGFFPLKWLAQGMRSVFLPEQFEAVEQSGEWALHLVGLNLGIWLVIGLVLSLATFRWAKRS